MSETAPAQPLPPPEMSQDEDVMRVIARMLADHGWFVEVRASRINEHFTVKEMPRAGWAFEHSP